MQSSNYWFAKVYKFLLSLEAEKKITDKEKQHILMCINQFGDSIQNESD